MRSKWFWLFAGVWVVVIGVTIGWDTRRRRHQWDTFEQKVLEIQRERDEAQSRADLFEQCQDQAYKLNRSNIALQRDLDDVIEIVKAQPGYGELEVKPKPIPEMETKCVPMRDNGVWPEDPK